MAAQVLVAELMRGLEMLLSNFPGMALTIQSWEQGKTQQTALQKRPQESCVCPSAAAKEALMLWLFLKQQLFWMPSFFPHKI